MTEGQEEQEVEPHHPLTDCGACPLYGGTYVPTLAGDGPALLVGQNPGAAEAKHGRPMSGPSGKVLGAAWAAAGRPTALSRPTLSNAVACTLRPKDKKPPAKAVACCAPRVRAEVAQAELVVALGGEAASALLGRRVGIRDEAVTEDVTDDGTRVVIAPNPAAVLRDPGWWMDLIGSLDRAGRTQVVWEPPPPPLVVSDPAGLVDAVRNLRTGQPWMLDVESTRPPAWDFSSPSRLRCVGIGTDRGVVVVDEAGSNRADVARLLTRLLEADGYVAHNAKYDQNVLEKFGIGGRLVGDPMFLAAAMDERPAGKGLEALAHRYVAAPRWKPELGKDEKGAWYDEVDGPALYAYNAMDVEVMRRLWDYQHERATADDLAVHAHLLEAGEMARRAERRGLLVDRERVETLIIKAEQAEKRAESALEGMNPGSWQQVLAAYSALGIDLPNTQELTLAEVTDPAGAELADKILAARGARTLLSRYLRPLLTLDTPDGRVHYSYRVTGTEAGRWSCAEPNIQNQPPVARAAFVAEDGKVLVNVDIKQNELRVLAALSGDERLLADLNSGVDIMENLARDTFGEQYVRKLHRPLAKTVVHGVDYGRGTAGIARGLRISPDLAERVKRTYLRTYPGVPRWQAATKAEVRRGEHLTTPLGRRRRFPPRLGWMDPDVVGEMERSALSFRPQAIGSDILVRAAIAAERRGVPVAVLVHDSVMAEVDPGDAREAARVIQECVAEAGREFTDRVAFTSEASTGTRWSELEEQPWSL